MSGAEVRVSGSAPPRSRVVSELSSEHEAFMRSQAQATSRDLSRVVQDIVGGQVPSTENMTAAMDRADKILLREADQNPLLLREDKARQTVIDTHVFLEASKNLLVHKTGDNKVQRFLANSRIASQDLSSQAKGYSSELLSGAGGEESEAVGEMRHHLALVLTHSRKVLLELSTSREFRDFITCSVDIIARLLNMPVTITGASVEAQAQAQAQAIVPTGGGVGATAKTIESTTEKLRRSVEQTKATVKEAAQAGQTGRVFAREPSVQGQQASVGRTSHLTAREEQGRSVSSEEGWIGADLASGVYEETDYRISASLLGSMDLPPSYVPRSSTTSTSATTTRASATGQTIAQSSQGLAQTSHTPQTTQTFVTDERGRGGVEHYTVPGPGPLAESSAPKIRVVERVYSSAPPGLTGRSVVQSAEIRPPLSSELRPSPVTSTSASATSISSGSSETVKPESSLGSSAANVMTAVQNLWEQNIDLQARQRIQTDVIALLNKMSNHPDHKQAVQSLFALAGLMWTSAPGAEHMAVPPSVSQVAADGKSILGSFAGGEENIDRLLLHIRLFATKLQKDPETERIVRKFGKYFVRGLDDPSLIQDAFFRQKLFNLIDRAGYLGERYAKDEDLKEMLASWRLIVANISNDHDLNAFGRSLLKLRDDVSYIDQAGTRRVDFATLTKLRGVVLPMLVEQLHFIPLPPISIDSDDLSVRLEDLVISFYDVLPEHIFVDTETHSDFKPLSDYEHEYIDKTIEGGHMFHEEGEMGTQKAYNRHHAWGYFKGRRAKKQAHSIRPSDKLAPHLTSDKRTATYGSSIALAPDLHHRSVAQMVIRAYNIQFSIKDLKFDVHRKKFPRVHAKGLADVHTQGSAGSKVIVRLDMAMDAYQANPLTGAAVGVKIAPLKVKIHQSNHDLFYTTMANLFAGTIRRQAEKAIVQRLELSMRPLLETMNGIFASTLGQMPGFRIAPPEVSDAEAMLGKTMSAANPTRIVSQQ